MEAADGWATSVRASKPPMTIMGKLGGVAAGLRQLRRSVPLETRMLRLPGGHQAKIPTADEALRVKAYLVVQRNQVRDYLDVAAMSDRLGLDVAAEVLSGIDSFYVDRSQQDESVVSELVVRLADPHPNDSAVLTDLSAYKGLAKCWQDWNEVVGVCGDLAQLMMTDGNGRTCLSWLSATSTPARRTRRSTGRTRAWSPRWNAVTSPIGHGSRPPSRRHRGGIQSTALHLSASTPHR